MEITAAVLRAPDSPYQLERVELAAPGPGQVRVRIAGTGLCHTDVLPRSPMSFAPLPIITGHEGSGVVEAIGSDVEGIAVGDHVVLSFDSCGACANCASGASAYCEAFFPRNLFGREMDGSTRVRDASGEDVSSRWFAQSSLATHCLATARNTVVVDADLPLELLGPLGCGILTGAGSILVALDVPPETSLVVFGTGAVGLAAVMAGRVAGASTIVAVDIHRHRLDLALDLGATHALDGTASDVVAQVQAVTGGGADFTFDTTGNPAVMANAIAGLRMGGVCGFVGIQTGDLVLDGVALIGKTVMGILEGGAEPRDLIPRLLGLWREGRFPFDRLIETFPLDQINEAEQASLSGRVIKPVLIPAG
ncbi:MAG TPA: NAD(P)-dependent alcohol dehydrogenase [Acidimicrobiales bacterium]|nr:NAD(P)-dependent alcohol dehydrogenase [Acidimicrobiales bacterium]